jgi:toxin ParE1/3/4
MKLRLALKPQADRDINNQFEYIAKDNLETAIRFYEAAFRAFDVLLTNPNIGPARDFENPQLKDIRIWLVKGFEKHLIFYRASIIYSIRLRARADNGVCRPARESPHQD